VSHTSLTERGPLLPGAGPHQVLVTSRQTLAGLGGRLVDVTVLNNQEAVDLLDTALHAARPDDDRISGDRRGADRLAGLCGGLPLALQIVGALLKADPALSTAELADQLASETERLPTLRYDDGSGMAGPSVAAAFELSCHRLDVIVARVFRLLSVSPGPDFSNEVAAVLADLPTAWVRRLLAGLAAAHLIEAAPGRPGRWRMHDLVRLYAQQLSGEKAEADGREQAWDRLFAYYMDRVSAADDHLRPLAGMDGPDLLTGRKAALAWLDTERASLVAAVAIASDIGRDQAALHLPIRLAEYFLWRRRFDDRISATTTSLDTARHLGDRSNEGLALINLGNALMHVRRFEEAITACQTAVDIYRQIGDQHDEGRALNNLGLVLHEVRRFEEAITAHQDAAAIYRETGDRHTARVRRSPTSATSCAK
jgi:tetratricopeptide (TPR) repeat protein